MGDARFFQFFRHLNFVTLRRAVTRAFQRRLVGLSAEMAYNAMLALFPAILAILTAIGMFEESIASTVVNLTGQIREIVPEQVWTLLLEFVQGVRVNQGGGWFSISFLAAIWVFSGALSAAMNALDQIHQVPSKQRRPFWKAKLLSIVLAIGTIVLLIVASFLVLLGDFAIQLAVSQNWRALLLRVWQLLGIAVIVGTMIVSVTLAFRTLQVPSSQQTFWSKVRSIIQITFVGIVFVVVVDFALAYIEDLTTQSEINQTIEHVLVSVWRLLSWPVALGIVATAFAFIYRFGPSRWHNGTPIMPGAIIAAISWAIVSAIFRLYVTNFGQYNKVYGAVGAVIVLMLWLFMSSLVMLLGDQLNATVGEAMRHKKQSRELAKRQKLPTELTRTGDEATGEGRGRKI
ncbi:MAG: YihY/virulence factor BrkB family protein [Cyanophyceae cyanobacterium]